MSNIGLMNSDKSIHNHASLEAESYRGRTGVHSQQHYASKGNVPVCLTQGPAFLLNILTMKAL